MSTPYLELRQLSKSLGKVPVIRELSLQMEQGDFLVVFGPSGGGKTTLLRLISGFLRPDRGEIRLDDQDVTGLEPDERNVAMAFQNFALYPHMTAFENIASPLRARGVAEADIRRRVHEITELLRIDHVLEHTPRELSNGQKQRTSLARSLVRQPRMLLLDDPLRNVDAKIRYEMRLELPNILRRYETTLIYVTQDYKEAMALGDRVGVLLDGQFRQIDKPADVYGQPRDIRVAQLFGDPPINLFRARPEAGNGRATLTLGGQILSAAGCPERVYGRDCLVGVRPEDISVQTEEAAGAIPVELEATMPLNVRTAMLLKLAGNIDLTASAWAAHARETVKRRRAWARIDLTRAVYFDPDSGVRL